MKVFDDRVCQLGEGPHYDERTNRVFWVDILGAVVLWRDLTTDEIGEVGVGAHIGAAVPRRDGGLVLCLPDGPALLDIDGTLRLLGTYAQADAAAEADAGAGRTPKTRPRIRSNDAKADPVGRLWLGTMAYDETPEAGALYRLDPGATTPVRVLDEVTVSNGMGWSRDGHTMYYIDSPTHRIAAWKYDLDRGEMSQRRVFVETPVEWGSPDGMCVDAQGGVWVAFYDGGAVRRFTADGKLDRVVEVGTPRVTSCAFAGKGFESLVITTATHESEDVHAGHTYVYQPGDVVGLPVDRYAG